MGYTGPTSQGTQLVGVYRPHLTGSPAGGVYRYHLTGSQLEMFIYSPILCYSPTHVVDVYDETEEWIE